MVFVAPAPGTAPTVVAAPGAVDLDELEEEIAELAAHMHAATYRLLVCLREFDARAGGESRARMAAVGSHG